MKHLLTSIIVLALLTVITGVLYPLAVTGIAQIVFPAQANGSIVTEAGKSAGSSLIGQPFTSPRYFWGRPSATGTFPYNPLPSTGSNLGPLNASLTAAVAQQVHNLRSADPQNSLPVPVDLVTMSASGLDPDISVASAQYQVPRVARARGVDEVLVRSLVERHIEGRQFGLLGERRVNVLLLNLALDEQLSKGQ
jgi:K+-transporting ATPase ATPase C chain